MKSWVFWMILKTKDDNSWKKTWDPQISSSKMTKCLLGCHPPTIDELHHFLKWWFFTTIQKSWCLGLLPLITIWLFNITMLFIGKPSVSMGHLYHGELLNYQRVPFLKTFPQISSPTIIPTGIFSSWPGSGAARRCWGASSRSQLEIVKWW